MICHVKLPFAPASRSASATVKPRPLAPPVTSITFPASENSGILRGGSVAGFSRVSIGLSFEVVWMRGDAFVAEKHLLWLNCLMHAEE